MTCLGKAPRNGGRDDDIMMFLAPRGTFPVAGVLFGGRGRVGGSMGRVSARLSASHHVTVVLDHMLKQNPLNSTSTKWL